VEQKKALLLSLTVELRCKYRNHGVTFEYGRMDKGVIPDPDKENILNFVSVQNFEKHKV
jgi:hypothetical protein